MRFTSRAIYAGPLMAAALLCVATPAHAGMSDWMDRAFTFREEQKPLVTPKDKTVPKMVYQPYYDSSAHTTWSTFYTRPDLEPQDYLSNSASKVMRPPENQPMDTGGGWEAINARGNANAAGAIAIGEPGEGPGVIGSDAKVGRKTIIGEAVNDWRLDASGNPLHSRPGDFDYRAADVNRPAKVDSNAVIGEPLASGSSSRDKGVDMSNNPLRHDSRYVSFDADGKVTGYVVQSGDTLSDIAGQPAIYGKNTMWPLIYSANRTAIGGSPKNLKVKQKLVIPRNYTDKQAKEAEKRGAKL